jgi:hypothetical protein
MAYTINRWDSTAIAVIEDGTVNQSLDIKLIGKNYAGYGEIQNENALFMLENFAGATSPAKAVRGQLWYDTSNKKIKLYTGDLDGAAKHWKQIGGADYSTSEPTYPNNGDFWFDTTKDQLKLRTGDAWLTIGPQTAGAGVTQMISRQVLGRALGSDVTTTFSIIIAIINDAPMYVISKDEFLIDSSEVDLAPLFTTYIKQGLTLPYCDENGIPPAGTNIYYWGVAAGAKGLVDEAGNFIPATDFVQAGSSNFTSTVRFSDLGYTVGASNDLAVFIEAGTEPVFQNTTGPRLTFKIRDGADTKSPLIINANNLEPGADATFSIGTSLKKWVSVWATNFKGIADSSNALLVGESYRSASASAGANTIAVRDASGNLTANSFTGTAANATRLATIRTINGVNFDGTTNIIVTDSTKLPLTGGTLSGFITLSADPTSENHAATKNYVDAKFGVGGTLAISSGGTGATTAANARANLDVASRTGIGASGSWNISAAQLAGYEASIPSVANTVVVRDASGIMYGTASTARYADLAEKYLADNDYEVGTVVTVGGNKEVTASHAGARAVGVVSGNPAYMMNSDLVGGTYIALKGRVPVKVTGAVSKGDELVAADGGCAVVSATGKTFAIALESSNDTGVKFIECLVL